MLHFRGMFWYKLCLEKCQNCEELYATDYVIKQLYYTIRSRHV